MNYISGTITFFNSPRGFGFITRPDGEQFFFHISHFAKGEYPVLEGQVEFKIAPAIAVGKKPQAVSVRYRRQEPCVTASPAVARAVDALVESMVPTTDISVEVSREQ